MGKRGKKPKHQPRRSAKDYYNSDQEEEEPQAPSHSDEGEGEEGEDEDETHSSTSTETPSKFQLYQESVQSPKGDISYLQKFFLMYVGGRVPLHFQEDFCGTALLRRSAKDYYNSDQEEEPQAPNHSDEGEGEEDENEEETHSSTSTETPSKFQLYQESVQSPKGDISYLQKFFLMYVRGRVPLHFQEDFCGTALLSTEWLRTDPRRTAVGVDLDLEALTWCLENNVNKIGADVSSRISLFHGNVLQPTEAKLVKHKLHDLMKSMTLSDSEVSPGSNLPELAEEADPVADQTMTNCSLPGRDIICAFNYSCCCLHRRTDLILYFKHVLDTLSKRGGIFVMDVYGGRSSEQELRLQRKFPNFTYVWEQAEFDIIQRTTRISLHFNLRQPQRKLRHAFSYKWRLWSLPEIKECLEEAGFHSVHFWIRQMPDVDEMRNSDAFNAGRDAKYEEVSTFQQQDAWNAYIVGVAAK